MKAKGSYPEITTSYLAFSICPASFDHTKLISSTTSTIKSWTETQLRITKCFKSSRRSMIKLLMMALLQPSLMRIPQKNQSSSKFKMIIPFRMTPRLKLNWFCSETKSQQALCSSGTVSRRLTICQSSTSSTSPNKSFRCSRSLWPSINVQKSSNTI